MQQLLNPFLQTSSRRLFHILSHFQHRTFMGSTMSSKTSFPLPIQPDASSKLATFAAGCFWGVEKSFRNKFSQKGLLDIQVGYCGGHDESNVNYKQVCTGSTGHAEAVQIKYDPSKLDFATLVDFFYRMHDPTQLNRQGPDMGTQYRSTIFYHDAEQKRIAEEETEKAQTHYGKAKIQTTIESIGKFFPGEEYHQDYLTVNPHGYECPTHFERSWERIEQLFHKQ